MKKALLVLLLVCPFILGQDLAKNDDKKVESKKPASVTVADLTDAEVKDGERLLITEPNDMARWASLAREVVNSPNESNNAKLLAYERMRLLELQDEDNKQARIRFSGKVQARTGCEGCGFYDFKAKKISKEQLKEQPAAKQ